MVKAFVFENQDELYLKKQQHILGQLINENVFATPLRKSSG